MLNAREIVTRARRVDRAKASLTAAGVNFTTTAHEIDVAGNTYPIKDALKAHGFKWVPGLKVWRYTLRSYKDLRFVCGRLSDGKVIHHKWPDLGRLYAEACRLMAA